MKRFSNGNKTKVSRDILFYIRNFTSKQFHSGINFLNFLADVRKIADFTGMNLVLEVSKRFNNGQVGLKVKDRGGHVPPLGVGWGGAP